MSQSTWTVNIEVTVTTEGRGAWTVALEHDGAQDWFGDEFGPFSDLQGIESVLNKLVRRLANASDLPCPTTIQLRTLPSTPGARQQLTLSLYGADGASES